MTTATTEPRTDVITAAHKRALRNADSIVFRLYQGQATIEANRDARHSSTGYDEKVTIHCGGARVNDCGRDHTYVPEDEQHRYSGFEMASSGIYDQKIRTLVDRISIGGTCTLLWTRSDNNMITLEKGIAVDHLLLQIRTPKKPNYPDVYLVRTFVGLDNSARMVKIDWNGA